MATSSKIAKICVIIASATLLFFGLLHLHGTFFTTDLYPQDIRLIERLKSSHIQMDDSGNIWKLWLGFNAMFSVGLAFIGAVNLYLSIRHFPFLTGKYFILLFTILCNAFFVWIGTQYMISAFVVSMAIPLVLYVAAIALTAQHDAS